MKIISSVKKQFGFQKTHCIEHVTIQLVDQTNSSFEKNLFTLGIFIDISKAFDTEILRSS